MIKVWQISGCLTNYSRNLAIACAIFSLLRFRSRTHTLTTKNSGKMKSQVCCHCYSPISERRSNELVITQTVISFRVNHVTCQSCCNHERSTVDLFIIRMGGSNLKYADEKIFHHQERDVLDKLNSSVYAFER